MSDYIADETGPDAAPIESIEQLLEHFERGGKALGVPRRHRVREGRGRPSYRRRDSILRSARVEKILALPRRPLRLGAAGGGSRIIALSGGRGRDHASSRAVRSGFSGKRTRRCTRRTRREHVGQIVAVGDELDVVFLGLGIQPFSTLDEIEWVPKKLWDHGPVHAGRSGPWASG